MSTSKKTQISNEVETKVVALIARGDTYEDIRATIKEEDEVEIGLSTITSIKKRNSSALAHISEKLEQHRVSRATRIIDKTHKQLEKKLDQAEEDDNRLRELGEKLRSGQISDKEYRIQSSRLVGLSVTELANVSEKMFKQAQASSGEDGELSKDPQKAKAQLVNFLQIINTGDPEAIVGKLFGEDDVQSAQVPD